MKKIVWSLTVLLVLFSSISCSSDSSESDSRVELNRKALLESIADNQVIPDFTDFSVETEALKVAANAFREDANENTLNNLRAAWLKAYKVFQPVATYDLGPAFDVAYYLNLNAHPLNVTEIEQDINNPNFNASDLNFSIKQDVQGLPAVDYLVNGLGETDTDILAIYNGTEGQAYKGFLGIVVDRIDNLTDSVLAAWNGGFRDDFVNNDTDSRTGSFNEFINIYIEYFERRLRSSKLGIPAGQFTTGTFPDQIEAVFMPEVSRELLLDALTNSQEIFIGSENTIGIASALEDLGREDIVAAVTTAFTNARNAINTLDQNLKLQIETDRQAALDARMALQEVVVLLKNDVVSALSITISFQDADGD